MLISLEEAKTFMGISVSSTDTLISTFISYTSAELEAYCDRLFSATSITEYLKFQGSEFDQQHNPDLDLAQTTPALFLRQKPIANLTLSYKGTALASGTDYIVDAVKGIIYIYKGLNDYQHNITATYSAGYATTDVPLDLKLVCCEGVRAMFERSGTAKQGSGDVVSKKVGDFSVVYGNGRQALTNMEMGQMLKTYITANLTTLNRYRYISL